MSDLVFISHAAVDEEIAKAIKASFKTAFPALDVFVSSDPEDLPPGTKWIEKILEALGRARLVLAVTTERGLSRKWVWFESGRTWHSGIECIPCCVGKIRKNELPPPFTLLQAVNIDEEQGFSAMLNRCGVLLGLEPEPLSVKAIVDELIRSNVRAEERQLIAQDPYRLELQQEVDVGMQRLNAGSREVLRILLKFDELTNANARLKIKESGKYTNETLLLAGLVNQTGWLVEVRRGPFAHVSDEEDAYKINPKIRPYLEAWFAKQGNS